MADFIQVTLGASSINFPGVVVFDAVATSSALFYSPGSGQITVATTGTYLSLLGFQANYTGNEADFEIQRAPGLPLGIGARSTGTDPVSVENLLDLFAGDVLTVVSTGSMPISLAWASLILFRIA